MTQDELQQKIQNNQVNFLTPEPPQTDKKTENQFSEYEPLYQALRRFKYHLTSAPTFTPKNFLEQIQLYDDGTNRRIYVYVNKTWRYTTLT